MSELTAYFHNYLIIYINLIDFITLTCIGTNIVNAL